MKKIILYLFVFLAICAVGIYFYLYKGHRDIAAEKADFAVTVADLKSEYAKGDSLFTKKYADKTIEVQGKVTSIDSAENGIVLDEKLFVTFNDSTKKTVSVGKLLKVKARFLAYDDLLEEFKMDQGTISQ